MQVVQFLPQARDQEKGSQSPLTLTDRLRPSFSGLSNSKMTDPFGPPVDHPPQKLDHMGETECLIWPQRWYIQRTTHPSIMIFSNREKLQATLAIKKVTVTEKDSLHNGLRGRIR
jgi:hypothetical protein